MGTDVADFTKFEIRVKAEKCETCIFRPGNLMSLKAGRLKQIVGDARAQRGHITCHDTLDPDVDGAICAGYAETYPDDCDALALGEQLSCLKHV